MENLSERDIAIYSSVVCTFFTENITSRRALSWSVTYTRCTVDTLGLLLLTGTNFSGF